MTRWPFLSPGWSHAICTTIAVILALYVAYFLQLESPYSAATTVLVVASPVHGMVLAKSVYRFLGTVVGAAASVLLMAWFAQTPELFLLGTAIWVGVFTAVSSLLRRFRAYGAVLAGYTITLVAFGAVDKPLSIFDLSMARIAVVTTGVACSALVTILLAPNTASRDFPLKLKAALSAVADFLERSLASMTAVTDTGSIEQEAAVTVDRLKAARQIQALDTALYAAAAESAATADRSGYVRRAVTALFGLLTSASSLRSSGELAADAEIRYLSRRAVELTRHLAHDGASADMAADIRTLRVESAAAQASLDSSAQPLAMIAHNRLDDLLDHLLAVTDSLVAFSDPHARRRDIRLPHYRDVPAALINGLRGMIAVGLLSVFWIYTAWPNGAQTFGAMVPICALLGASERQQADSIGFFIGVFIAALAGLICGYGLLTQISGFPLLALAMAPFILAGAYFSTRPKTAGIATGFLIFFVTFVGPRNPMQFDLASYLNTVFANLVGMAALLPVFRVFFPQHHGRSSRNLARQLVVGLMRLAKRPSPARLLRWEHQAHDRLTTIALRLPLDDADRTRLLHGGFAAIRIGRDLARTKAQMDLLPLNRDTQAAIRHALAACRHLADRPGRAVQSLWVAANQLEAGIDALPADQVAPARRAVAALRECADLLVQHEAFFTGRSRKTLPAAPLRLQEAM
jgi:uncharacterized membrane protein YccC